MAIVRKEEPLFESLNPYDNVLIIEDSTVKGAFERLRKIRTPVSVRHILSHDGKVYLIVAGDVRTRDRKV